MKHHLLLQLVPALALGLLASSCDTTPDPSVVEAIPDRIVAPRQALSVSFEKEIKPLLEKSCVNCHNRKTLPERVSFESRTEAFASPRNTPVIVPGKPAESFMIQAIQIDDTAEQAMPPVGHRIAASDVDLLKRWIEEGAHWPTGAAGRIKPTMEIRE